MELVQSDSSWFKLCAEGEGHRAKSVEHQEGCWKNEESDSTPSIQNKKAVSDIPRNSLVKSNQRFIN